MQSNIHIIFNITINKIIVLRTITVSIKYIKFKYRVSDRYHATNNGVFRIFPRGMIKKFNVSQS